MEPIPDYRPYPTPTASGAIDLADSRSSVICSPRVDRADLGNGTDTLFLDLSATF
jgi:hypothetical protein